MRAVNLQSMAICISIGLFLRWIGRGSRPGTLYQKEAMAVVGLSWILATILGALPYKLSQTQIATGQPITFIEAMFESQSGSSGTEARL